jgi:hypothetical protein
MGSSGGQEERKTYIALAVHGSLHPSRLELPSHRHTPIGTDTPLAHVEGTAVTFRETDNRAD